MQYCVQLCVTSFDVHIRSIFLVAEMLTLWEHSVMIMESIFGEIQFNRYDTIMCNRIVNRLHVFLKL